MDIKFTVSLCFFAAAIAFTNAKETTVVGTSIVDYSNPESEQILNKTINDLFGRLHDFTVAYDILKTKPIPDIGKIVKGNEQVTSLMLTLNEECKEFLKMKLEALVKNLNNTMSSLYERNTSYLLKELTQVTEALDRWLSFLQRKYKKSHTYCEHEDYECNYVIRSNIKDLTNNIDFLEQLLERYAGSDFEGFVEKMARSTIRNLIPMAKSCQEISNGN